MHIRGVPKQRTQRKTNDEAGDTKWPNRPHTSEGKEQVIPQKWHTQPNLQHQHLHTQDDKQERSQRSFDFVQIVYRTEKSKKFELVEVNGDLFDFT